MQTRITFIKFPTEQLRPLEKARGRDRGDALKQKHPRTFSPPTSALGPRLLKE